MAAREVLHPRESGTLTPGQVEVLAAHLTGGGVVAYPTETVYGLGAIPTPEGVERVRTLKGRGPGQPMIVLIAGEKVAGTLAWNDRARALAAAFWPGPLTLVLEDRGGSFPPGARSDEGRVGVRVSPHPTAMGVARAAGGAVLSTSANRSGDPPLAKIYDLLDLLDRLDPEGEVLVIDGGDLAPSSPSTVVDCTGADLRIVREGAVARGEILALAGGLYDG